MIMSSSLKIKIYILSNKFPLNYLSNLFCDEEDLEEEGEEEEED